MWADNEFAREADLDLWASLNRNTHVNAGLRDGLLHSLASKDGLLATIGAASINPAAVPGHSKLADHEDVL